MAMLESGMPLMAMTRNLGNMTRIGVIKPGSEGEEHILYALKSQEKIRKSRVHPIAFLTALRTYASGGGWRSQNTWAPAPRVIDALDGAFYLAFGNIEPTGKRFLLALDVSGSMGSGDVGGVPNLTPRDASAAMALVTAATEPAYSVVGFTKGNSPTKWRGYGAALTPLGISAKQRLDDAIRVVADLPFGGTDCSLPMVYAKEQNLEVDAFVVYTDSETWAGKIHPDEALRQYRRASGIPAKLVVVGMLSNGFTIANPNDAGMLDVVGFDTATPQVMSEFVR
jgi:60 kDa SS-A/Ro ribonucleoprotein